MRKSEIDRNAEGKQRPADHVSEIARFGHQLLPHDAPVICRESNEDGAGGGSDRQRDARPFAHDQSQQDQRIIFHEAGGKVDDVGQVALRRSPGRPQRRSADQGEDENVEIGAFQQEHDGRRQAGENGDQERPARVGAQQKRHHDQKGAVEDQPHRRRMPDAEPMNRQIEQDWRIGERTVERIARIGIEHVESGMMAIAP